MNEILPTGLEALLQRPAFRVLGEPLRRQLLALWEPGTDAAAATMRMDWSALAQMGDALARLNAEEPVVLAALLADLPGLRARRAELGLPAPMLAVVDGLLDSQDAADQVWALHAGREAGRNGEGLRRLLLAIIRDLRVVPILLARQLALLHAAQRPD